ncbi:MAG: carboxypeptidase-like regulatory domain-containing protein [Bacteroidota bacterium]|nr:carboxypeptidase-like regulatory domain-containing protein [Bacteroidota bacterium]
MKRNYVVYYLINYVILLIISQSVSLLAQQQVRGVVIDTDTDIAMPFVNIAVVGSTYGTVSNQNGEFTLNLERIGQSDSIAFYYIAYKTFTIAVSDMTDGMTVKIREKPVKLRTIAIIANPYSPKELIQKALERREVNYPRIAQKREVFIRSNNASYINAFDITLEKSTIPEIDEKIVKEMVDSIPRYNRSYTDHLYTLYSIPPQDSAKAKYKVEGIKHVILKEDDGGGLDRIEKVLTDLFDTKTDDNTFWKYRTGILSFKESHVEVSGLENDSVQNAEAKRDSMYRIVELFVLTGDLPWGWDFIQKPNRYKYQNVGIIGIRGEDAYALSFTGLLGSDYQGMIYISIETYAILRIEYSLKQRKKEKGIKLLGVNYNEEVDAGLLLYEKDEFGYFPKYTMQRSANRYGVKRAFEIIRKEKRPLFNKKLYEAALDLNLQGYQESCFEQLVVYRESFSDIRFRNITEKAVKPERITSYSDTIWEGYSIIEPTKQMKEYQAKINK